VLEIVGIEDDSFEVRLSDGSDFYFSLASFQDLDIQPLQLLSKPLQLLPNKPVTFEGVVMKEDLGVRDDWVIFAPEEYVGKRFRCVEIVEEAK
jgi:hypothetical protein